MLGLIPANPSRHSNLVTQQPGYDSPRVANRQRRSTTPFLPIMIAEILLVLAGHSSSLFPKDHNIHPAFEPLLHPGERQCIESLGRIAFRYQKIKQITKSLSRSQSRYICALCSTLNQILKDEYEAQVVATEAKVLKRDSTLVASGSFVPVSSIRATFAEWDAPFIALESLLTQLQSQTEWKPGPLIDLLLLRSSTGTHRIASIMNQLSMAVQRVWRTQLIAFLVHGSVSSIEPIASKDFTLLEGSIPLCVSVQSINSITYVGRALGTVKAANWQEQPPRRLAMEHTKLLEGVLVEDQHAFDQVIAEIRTDMSEWLWLNVLTQKDVEDAVHSLCVSLFLQHAQMFRRG